MTVKGKPCMSALFALALDFKQTWHSVTACLGPLSCWEMNPFPHYLQPEGMACLWRMEWCFSFGQCVVHLMHITSSWEGKPWIFPPSNLTVCFMPLCKHLMWPGLAMDEKGCDDLWKSLQHGSYWHFYSSFTWTFPFLSSVVGLNSSVQSQDQSVWQIHCTYNTNTD